MFIENIPDDILENIIENIIVDTSGKRWLDVKCSTKYLDSQCNLPKYINLICILMKTSKKIRKICVSEKVWKKMYINFYLPYPIGPTWINDLDSENEKNTVLSNCLVNHNSSTTKF